MRGAPFRCGALGWAAPARDRLGAGAGRAATRSRTVRSLRNETCGEQKHVCVEGRASAKRALAPRSTHDYRVATLSFFVSPGGHRRNGCIKLMGACWLSRNRVATTKTEALPPPRPLERAHPRRKLHLPPNRARRHAAKARCTLREKWSTAATC